MMDRAALLKSIRERQTSDRYGIGLASTYLKSLSGCFDGGYCPRAMNGVSAEEWAGVLKDAESKFVYCEKGMNIDTKSIEDAPQTDYLVEFECTVTSNKKDRDGDVLETRGAILDPMAPLLWQHDPFHPIGKVLRRTGQTNTKLNARCCILDFGDRDGELAEMARDAAVLVRANALRISHGFDPRDFKAMDSEDSRYLISSFEILEVSLVSIPSNTDAVISAFTNKKLHSALIKGYAEGLYRARPVQGKGVTFDKSHSCHCGGTCDDCQKSAAAHQHGSVRHEGESLADCVSRKIEILMNEGGRSQQQCEAIAYSMCGEKAMTDLGISRESLTPKDTVMSTETKPVVVQEKTPDEKAATQMPNIQAGPMGGQSPATESRPQDDRENFLGQGPSQGDRDWPGRHMSGQVVDQQMPGVSTFDVSNTADDAIMAIASGSMSGTQQNAAPDTLLATNAGPAGQLGVPTPTMGVQTPVSMPTMYNVSTSPGPQGSRSEPSLTGSVQGPKGTVPAIKEQSVNEGMQVQPLDTDSASHHDVQGTIDRNVIVDVPHLKAVAKMVQHSGQEGAMYVHPEKGHVHHVAHPDDLHPNSAHLYHSHDEIQKLYKSVKGVSGVKVAIQQHPAKGAGYSMMYKGGHVAGADMPMGDGTERCTATPAQKMLLNLKGRLEYLFHNAGTLKDAEAKKILADGYAGLMQLIKSSGIDPLGNGMSASLPAENTLDQHSLGNFTGLPGNNDLDRSSITSFQGAAQSAGVPAPNALNQDSISRAGSNQTNSPAANPPTGKQAGGVDQTGKPVQPHNNGIVLNGEQFQRRIDPDMKRESVGDPNIPGSLAYEYPVLGVSSNVLNENNVMEWLTGEPVIAVDPKSHASVDREFDELFAKMHEESVDFSAKEFEEMFAK